MFALTHPQIIDALACAVDRGVQVFLYLDALNFKNTPPALKNLMDKCVQVYKQKQAVLLHHKFCLIDKKIFILGSSNWSKSGFKKNEEVVLIFDTLSEKQINDIHMVIETLQQELEKISIEPLAA
jgi:mitochondrial cardiolipin hydrolase